MVRFLFEDDVDKHNFYLRDGQFKRLLRLAARTDIKASEHIRIAIEQYLDDADASQVQAFQKLKRGCKRGQ